MNEHSVASSSEFSIVCSLEYINVSKELLDKVLPLFHLNRGMQFSLLILEKQ